MKESMDTIEEEKITSLMESVSISGCRQRDDRTSPERTRTGSVPPGFQSSYLFSYQEGDFYTHSFAQGNPGARGASSPSNRRKEGGDECDRPESPMKRFREKHLGKPLDLRKLSAISSGDEDSNLSSPTLLGKSSKYSNISPTLAEAKRNAEALIRGLDDQETQFPEIAEEGPETRPESGGELGSGEVPMAAANYVTNIQYPQSSVYSTTIQSPLVVINNYATTPPLPYYASVPYYSPLSYVNPMMMVMQQPGETQYVECSPGVYCPVAPMMYYPASTVISAAPVQSHEKVIKEFLQDIGKALNDQSSCRLLQKKLEEEDKSKRVLAGQLYEKMIGKIGLYMRLPFGNYLCQKLFEFLSPDQLHTILKSVKEKVVEICNDLHGTRSIQQLIEVSAKSAPLRRQVAEMLTSHVLEIITDINGNHVIQQCLRLLRSPENDFLFLEATEHCQQIGMHKHGCCVLQRCISAATEVQRAPLMSRVVELSREFVKDQYGNYVVQYVIDMRDMQINARVTAVVLPEVLDLAIEKFSSNVIEKLLEHNLEELKREIIDRLLTLDSYLSFLLNPYGNYVIQKALDHATAEQRRALLKKIKGDVPVMRGKGGEFGKKIAAKLIKAYPTIAS